MHLVLWKIYRERCMIGMNWERDSRKPILPARLDDDDVLLVWYGDNATEANKNICCTKGENLLDHSTLTRGFKTFPSGCMSLNDNSRSGKPKTVDSEVMLRDIEANLASSIRRVSGNLGVQCHFVTFTNSEEASRAVKFCPTLQKYCFF